MVTSLRNAVCLAVGVLIASPAVPLHAHEIVDTVHLVITGRANANTWGNQLSSSQGDPKAFNSLQLSVPDAKVAAAVTGQGTVTVKDAATTAAGQGAAPTAPTSLAATSATQSAVSLTWAAETATKFVVERKALGAAWPAAAATARTDPARLTPSTIVMPDESKATDTAIDPFATYVYRIRTVGAGSVLSPPSNEITVGPPPVGFSSIIPAPKAMHEHDSSQFANLTRVTLDANGDPAVAYVSFDLDNNGERPDSDLFFISWSRARYRWNAPVRVDTVGDVATNGNAIPLSLAHDESNGLIGLAYVVGSHELRLAASTDGGATWTPSTVVKTGDEEGLVSTPSLALASGQAYTAYFVGGVGVRYATGASAQPPLQWKTVTAPLLPGTEQALAGGVTVVAPADNTPGVLYWLSPSEGYTSTAAFWRPGSTPVKIADTAGKQTDDPGLTAAASGTHIGVGLYAARDEHFFADHHLWFTQSSDGGATWSPVVVVADDGGNAMGAPFTVAIDRKDRAALVANVAGGNEGANKCGQPKLARPGANGTWITCGADTRGAGPDADVYAPTATFAANDRLYVVFKVRGTVPSIAPGLVLWRER